TATLAETRSATARLAANDTAALVVHFTRNAGTAALAVSRASPRAPRAAESATPRRASRSCKYRRALDSLLQTVPSLRRSWRATSARLCPSRKQSTNGSRYLLGSRWISSLRAVCNSRLAACHDGSRCGGTFAWASCTRLRAALVFAFMAV